jgi:hypothetical protein
MEGLLPVILQEKRHLRVAWATIQATLNIFKDDLHNLPRRLGKYQTPLEYDYEPEFDLDNITEGKKGWRRHMTIVLWRLLGSIPFIEQIKSKATKMECENRLEAL